MHRARHRQRPASLLRRRGRVARQRLFAIPDVADRRGQQSAGDAAELADRHLSVGRHPVATDADVI